MKQVYLYLKGKSGHDKNRKKGFTLAELLIVVAIIGVLVAIAIPVFTNQLESSRQAADLSSIRNAYAEAAIDAMNEEGRDGYAETGIMKHTGPFDRLGEARINNLDLKTNDAEKIVKDYTVIVVVSAFDGSATIGVGQGGHIEGKTATAADIEKIRKEYKEATNTDGTYYIGYKSASYEKFWTNGSTLTLYRPSSGGYGGTVDATHLEKAEYGVSKVIVVNDSYNRRYFMWDGARWYMTTGAGGKWIKID